MQPHQIDCLRFHLAKGLGNHTFGKLVQYFDSAKGASSANVEEWQKAQVSASKYAAYQRVSVINSVKVIDAWLNQNTRHNLISYDDKQYPQIFRNLSDPPPLLFVKGSIEALTMPSIAIVGSRNASPLGLKIAQKFAYSLAKCGFCIVSGLAAGIDGAAHMGAVSAQGQSIAFLGTGVNIIYPRNHQELANKITDTSGALVSELAISTPPYSRNFPPRNRLISSLTMATLVVECRPKSGSMITARLALEMGKELFAIPGSIMSEQSLGCHKLIQQGAHLVTCVEDILEGLPEIQHSKTFTNPTEKSPQSLEISEQKSHILEQMEYAIIQFEELQKITQLSHVQLQGELLQMELIGVVKSLSGNRWQRLQ